MSVLIISNQLSFALFLREELERFGFKVFIIATDCTKSIDDIFSIRIIDNLQDFLLEHNIDLLINALYINYESQIEFFDSERALNIFKQSYQILTATESFTSFLGVNFRYLVLFHNGVFGLQNDDDSQDILNPYSHHASLMASILLIHNSYKKQALLSIEIVFVGSIHGRAQSYSFLNSVIDNALLERAITVHGDGNSKRNWLNIADLCNVICLMINKKTVQKEIYLAGENFSNIDLIYKICDEIDAFYRNRGVEKISARILIKFVTARDDVNTNYSFHASDMQKILGYELQHYLEKSLPKLIEDSWEKLKN